MVSRGGRFGQAVIRRRQEPQQQVVLSPEEESRETNRQQILSESRQRLEETLSGLEQTAEQFKNLPNLNQGEREILQKTNTTLVRRRNALQQVIARLERGESFKRNDIEQFIGAREREGVANLEADRETKAAVRQLRQQLKDPNLTRGEKADIRKALKAASEGEDIRLFRPRAQPSTEQTQARKEFETGQGVAVGSGARGGILVQRPDGSVVEVFESRAPSITGGVSPSGELVISEATARDLQSVEEGAGIRGTATDLRDSVFGAISSAQERGRGRAQDLFEEIKTRGTLSLQKVAGIDPEQARLEKERNQAIQELNPEIEAFNKEFGGRDLTPEEFSEAEQQRFDIESKLQSIEAKNIEIDRIREEQKNEKGIRSDIFNLISRPEVLEPAEFFGDLPEIAGEGIRSLTKDPESEASKQLGKLVELSAFATPVGIAALTGKGITGTEKALNVELSAIDRTIGASEAAINIGVLGVAGGLTARNVLKETSVVIKQPVRQAEISSVTLQDVVRQGDRIQTAALFKVVTAKPERFAVEITKGDRFRRAVFGKALPKGKKVKDLTFDEAVNIFQKSRVTKIEKATLNVAITPSPVLVEGGRIRGAVKRGGKLSPFAEVVNARGVADAGNIRITKQTAGVLEGGVRAKDQFIIASSKDLDKLTKRALKELELVNAAKGLEVRFQLPKSLKVEKGDIKFTELFKITKKDVQAIPYGRRTTRADITAIQKKVARAETGREFGLTGIEIRLEKLAFADLTKPLVPRVRKAITLKELGKFDTELGKARFAQITAADVPTKLPTSTKIFGERELVRNIVSELSERGLIFKSGRLRKGRAAKELTFGEKLVLKEAIRFRDDGLRGVFFSRGAQTTKRGGELGFGVRRGDILLKESERLSARQVTRRHEQIHSVDDVFKISDKLTESGLGKVRRISPSPLFFNLRRKVALRRLERAESKARKFVEGRGVRVPEGREFSEFLAERFSTKKEFERFRKLAEEPFIERAPKKIGILKGKAIIREFEKPIESGSLRFSERQLDDKKAFTFIDSSSSAEQRIAQRKLLKEASKKDTLAINKALTNVALKQFRESKRVVPTRDASLLRQRLGKESTLFGLPSTKLETKQPELLKQVRATGFVIRAQPKFQTKLVSRQLPKLQTRAITKTIVKPLTKLEPKITTKQTTRLTTKLQTKLTTKQIIKTPTLITRATPISRIKERIPFSLPLPRGRRRRRKGRRISTFDDIALAEGFTARTLKFKPIKIPRQQLPSAAIKFQTAGTRRRPIVI